MILGSAFLLTGLAAVGVALALAAASRGAPDAGGRSDAVYVHTVLAVTLFLALLSAAAALGGSVAAVVPRAWDVSLGDPPSSAVLAVGAGVAYRWHGRRARQLLAQPGPEGSAVRRVRATYLYLVCAGAVLVAVFASAPAVLGLAGVLAPGGRTLGLARLVPGGTLLVGALVIFRVHWGRRGAP